MNKVSYTLPVAVELSGILILILGVTVELTTSADLGHTLISTGSILIAAGSLIWSKVFRREKRRKSGKP